MSGYLGTEIKKPAANTAVRFREIPICRYRLSISDEKRIYTPRDFLRLYRDMVLIREFETMLLSLQRSGSYHGVTYPWKKTFAADIGREALFVGEAYCADPGDDFFSADKNIGALLAKGLCAIEKMTEAELTEIMRTYHDGAVLSPLGTVADSRANVKDVALDFLLYGVLSEIFGKITGFCYGSGGSRNVCFTPFGFQPSNVSEGDSAGAAIGAALYRKNCGLDGYVLANINAGAAFEGQTWEALCLAESGAFRTQKNQGLPILFVLIRGRDGEESESVIRRCNARIAAGLGPNMMYAETVNASDPLAVIEAVSRKKEILKRGEGSALLEMVCDCLQENPKGTDPLKLYRDKLLRGNIIGASDLKALEDHIAERMAKIFRLAADDEKSPPAGAFHGEDCVFENTEEPMHAARKIMPRVKIAKRECSRFREILRKRAGNAGGYQMQDAIFEPIVDRFYRDPDFAVFSMSIQEDGVLSGISEAVEQNRFLRLPFSAATVLSCAFGYVLRGGRALVSLDGEKMTGGADALIRRIAEWRLQSGGGFAVPLAVRVPVEKQNGMDRGEMLLSSAASVPGLKVLYPATPYDAGGMAEAALDEETPVVWFEAKALYGIGEKFEKNGVPGEPCRLPIGEPSLKREGDALTVLTVGAALYTAEGASVILSDSYGIEAEIFSARTVVPLDPAPVLRSIEKTGRLLIVGEDSERGSVMRELAAVFSELAFDLLDAPVVALGANDESEIIRAVHRKMIPLHEKI